MQKEIDFLPGRLCGAVFLCCLCDAVGGTDDTFIFGLLSGGMNDGSNLHLGVRWHSGFHAPTT